MWPRVTDNDKGEITVSLDGKQLRGWSYVNDNERRQKMVQAREYVEGWCDSCARLKTRIDIRLNDGLCGMKPDYDDSIVGFNEAWDIVRKIFDETGPAVPWNESAASADQRRIGGTHEHSS